MNMARPGISVRVSSYSARTGDGREEEKQMGPGCRQEIMLEVPEIPADPGETVSALPAAG